jgi:hypothetical protein
VGSPGNSRLIEALLWSFPVAAAILLVFWFNAQRRARAASADSVNSATGRAGIHPPEAEQAQPAPVQRWEDEGGALPSVDAARGEDEATKNKG